MKAEELRIGNLIKGIYHDYGIDEEIENETICKVATLDVSGNGDYPIYVYSNEDIEHFSEFKPIPLTEEWLLKFGFEFHINANCQNFYYEKDAFICIRGDEDFEWFRYYNGDFYHELKYVHQLQNLYFALTGEELTLKP